MLMNTMPQPIHPSIYQIPNEEIEIPVRPRAQQTYPSQNTLKFLQPILNPSPIFAETDVTDAPSPKGYKFIKRIGQGEFGKVYLATDNRDVWAVKTVFNQDPELFLQHTKLLTVECQLLKQLSHKNIVSCLGLIKTSNAYSTQMYMFMEFMDKGSLKSICQRLGCISEDHARYIVREILNGVLYLHSNWISHRDIKADNILVDAAGRIKLGDFSITKQQYFIRGVIGLQTKMTGTLTHMAPEILLGRCYPDSTYGCAADIWSIGCTCIEMLTACDPQSIDYINSRYYEQLRLSCFIDAYRPSNISDACWAFIKSALNTNQHERPIAFSLLCDRWITMMLPLR